MKRNVLVVLMISLLPSLGVAQERVSHQRIVIESEQSESFRRRPFLADFFQAIFNDGNVPANRRSACLLNRQ